MAEEGLPIRGMKALNAKVVKPESGDLILSPEVDSSGNAEDGGAIFFNGSYGAGLRLIYKDDEIEVTGAAAVNSSFDLPAGAIVQGVTGRVTQACTNAITFDCGLETVDTDAFGDDIDEAIGTTFNSYVDGESSGTFGFGTRATAAQAIVITPSGDTGGVAGTSLKVRVGVWYWVANEMTS